MAQQGVSRNDSERDDYVATGDVSERRLTTKTAENPLTVRISGDLKNEKGSQKCV
ncbi:MAG: hypothetical protein ACI4VW_01400 [Acutalibacteraceae bacterium]